MSIHWWRYVINDRTDFRQVEQQSGSMAKSFASEASRQISLKETKCQTQLLSSKWKA